MAYVRTNVVLDDRLVKRIMRRYGFRTKRETIDFALRRLDGTDDPWARMLELEGSGWEGDLDEMRRTRFPEV
jgi:Arc/MetJ family transcription regulator